jgi:flagellar biosynthesis/type III secretory pathway protein FliH
VFHHAAEPEDVFILGETSRLSYPTHAALATAAELVAAAEARAVALVEEAEDRAAEMLTTARKTAASVTADARNEGLSIGRAEAEAEAVELLKLVRIAAADGKRIRDNLAEQAATVIASATGIALRKLTGEYYEADPGRTAAICTEALRAASGQEVLALRVNPFVVPAVQATLRGTAAYVVPDGAVEIGGCIVDLRHGTLDASIESRLSLMEFSLRRAAGGESQ